jgi:hypothetical protein
MGYNLLASNPNPLLSILVEQLIVVVGQEGSSLIKGLDHFVKPPRLISRNALKNCGSHVVHL